MEDSQALRGVTYYCHHAAPLLPLATLCSILGIPAYSPRKLGFEPGPLFVFGGWWDGISTCSYKASLTFWLCVCVCWGCLSIRPSAL